MSTEDLLNWNKLKKPLAITVLITITIILIMVPLKSYIVNTHFERQPVVSFEESREITKQEGYGKVVVIEGLVVYSGSRSFNLRTNFTNYLEIIKTDKLNCEPQQGAYYKVAGAWNPETMVSDKFYAVWIVGGCS